MKLGQKIKFVPFGCNQKVTGTVAWIHPEKRFVTLEYKMKARYGGQATRMMQESFLLLPDGRILLD